MFANRNHANKATIFEFTLETRKGMHMYTNQNVYIKNKYIYIYIYIHVEQRHCFSLPGLDHFSWCTNKYVCSQLNHSSNSAIYLVASDYIWWYCGILIGASQMFMEGTAQSWGETGNFHSTWFSKEIYFTPISCNGVPTWVSRFVFRNLPISKKFKVYHFQHHLFHAFYSYKTPFECFKSPSIHMDFLNCMHKPSNQALT